MDSENCDAETDAKKSVDTFTQNGFKTITEGIRNSNSLPIGSDWNFYKLSESFCKIINHEGDRLLGLMNTILRQEEIEGNIRNRGAEEKIELIVEANDTVLERVGDNIDEINGIKKKSVEPIIEFQAVSAQLPINGSWNRINKATFSVSSSLSSLPGKERSAQAIHLLTGKNIVRPQKFFKDKIDNSNGYPWEPRIKDKPNSMKPLAVYLEETEFGDVFCHPYEVELERFAPPEHQLTKTEPVVPKLISETPLHEISTSEALNDLVEELRTHSVFAVDLEHHSYRTFLGITCLMQISTIDADYLIDTLKLRDKLHVLNEVFTKPSIVKVFHGADLDVIWLQRDLSLYIVNMFDTHQAAKQLGYSALSLAYLLNRFCKFVPNKQFQLADWRIRPLPEELKNYAREDTHYLIYIYHMLRNELLSQGHGSDNILRSVIQKSTEICKKRFIKPILQEDSHLDFYHKCKRSFDNRQMYALKELYQWRDKLAREEDESTGYVLPNHMLLQISEALPREVQGILACCNPIPPLVRSNLLELHKIILLAREQSLEKPIFKEDTRGRGSTQQFSKINVDSPLHCPHDLTKQNEFRDDLPTLLGRGESVSYETPMTCIEKKKSRCSVFNSPDNSDDEIEHEAVSKIHNLKFLGPYERYKLVKPFVQAEEKKAAEEKRKDEELDDVEDRIASLHEHFKKVSKEMHENVVSEDRNTSPKIKPVQTLLSMGATKKRKRDESEENDECKIPENPLPDLKVKKVKNDGLCTNNQIKDTNQDARVRNKRKRKKNNQDDSVPNKVKPYDYSAVDYAQFKGGASNTNHSRQIECKFKGKNKNRRFSGKRNNKHFTFSNKRQKGHQ